MKINRNEFDEWRLTSWHEYAAETLESGTRLIWLVNFYGDIRVLLGTHEVYCGPDFDRAELAWDSQEEQRRK